MIENNCNAIVLYRRTPRIEPIRLRLTDAEDVTVINNPYAVLGMPSRLNISFDKILLDPNLYTRWTKQIDDAYFQLMRRYHPDILCRQNFAHEWERKQMEDICKEITSAYELLSDAKRSVQFHLAQDEDNVVLASIYFENMRREAKKYIRELKMDYVAALTNQQMRCVTNGDGLVITRAIYGCLDVSNIQPCKPLTTFLQDRQCAVIDVTAPLQVRVSVGLVKKERHPRGTLRTTTVREQVSLQLPARSKCCQAGFYDIAPGHHKYLVVRYRFAGHLHQAIVQDNDPLRIPMKCHLMSPPAIDDADYEDPSPIEPPMTPDCNRWLPYNFHQNKEVYNESYAFHEPSHMDKVNCKRIRSPASLSPRKKSSVRKRSAYTRTPRSQRREKLEYQNTKTSDRKVCRRLALSTPQEDDRFDDHLDLPLVGCQLENWPADTIKSQKASKISQKLSTTSQFTPLRDISNQVSISNQTCEGTLAKIKSKTPKQNFIMMPPTASTDDNLHTPQLKSSRSSDVFLHLRQIPMRQSTHILTTGRRSLSLSHRSRAKHERRYKDSTQKENTNFDLGHDNKMSHANAQKRSVNKSGVPAQRRTQTNGKHRLQRLQRADLSRFMKPSQQDCDIIRVSTKNELISSNEKLPGWLSTLSLIAFPRTAMRYTNEKPIFFSVLITHLAFQMYTQYKSDNDVLVLPKRVHPECKSLKSCQTRHKALVALAAMVAIGMGSKVYHKSLVTM